MPLPKKATYTIEDLYTLPEGERAELIDGQIYYFASPGRQHQKIVMNVAYEIKNYINQNKGKCEVYPAPFAVVLNEEEHTYVEPDISVVCDKDKLNDKGCKGAPDWVIEIVSPTSRKRDYYTKVALYQQYGVKDYWIIDPMKNVITVYDFAHENPPALYGIGGVVESHIFDDLVIDFSKIDME